MDGYTVPGDSGRWAALGASVVTGPAPWAAMALGNAAEAGARADAAPGRRREHAEDEVWH